MKFINKILPLFLIPVFIYGWGDKGHKLIAKQAMSILPIEIGFSEQIKNAIVDHSIDPDYRKKQDPAEPNKHFIDIDYYKEFLNGHIIQSKDSLVKIYGESEVVKQGLLPWATEETYSKLVDAFKEKNKDNIILYASDLAHYVGDGHQPQHACLNYNGQLTNQKGIHFRYEIEMIDRYLPELEKELKTGKINYIKNIGSYVFGYITESNHFVDQILSADKSSSEKSGGKFDDEYYNLLWNGTKYVTVTEIEMGADSLASLIYSAWVDAGKPVLEL